MYVDFAFKRIVESCIQLNFKPDLDKNPEKLLPRIDR